jgi:tetratricopeptide (TPR) repeat protein
MSGLARTARATLAWLWRNLTLIVFGTLSLVLAPHNLSYNHTFGIYALFSLALLNLRVYFGGVSAFDITSTLTILSISVWMLVYHNADVVPYMGILLFSVLAGLYLTQLARGRPRPFRDAARVAENYLDSAARALLCVVCVVLSLVWMPDVKYITVPMTVLVVFRLAAPLRRVAYPALLRLFGVEPDTGVARPAASRRRGLTLARAAVFVGSVTVAIVVARDLVFTDARYDVTIPPPYTLPRDLMLKRKAVLEAYVAEPPGYVDPVALTELGLVLHSLGMSDVRELKRAEKILDRALLLEPTNAEALAWHGSTVVASAIFENNTMRRMNSIERGMEELNRAVRLAPDNPVVYLARVEVLLGIPRFLTNLGAARADVEQLLRLTRTRPEATAAMLPAIHQVAGDLYALLGDRDLARTHWQAALDLLPSESQDYQTIASHLAQSARAADRDLPRDPHAAARMSQ